MPPCPSYKRNPRHDPRSAVGTTPTLHPMLCPAKRAKMRWPGKPSRHRRRILKTTSTPEDTSEEMVARKKQNCPRVPKWIGREEQEAILQDFFAALKRRWRAPNEMAARATAEASLYVQGPPGTGKTSVLSSVLDSQRHWLGSIVIDCVSFENDRAAFKLILTAATRGKVELPPLVRLDDFVRILSMASATGSEEAIALVFDRAEWMRKRLTPGTLSAIHSMSSIIGRFRIMPIFVSEAPWDPQRDQHGSSLAMVVPFPSYCLSDAQEIVASMVLSDLKSGDDPRRVREVLHHIVDMLFHGCTDVRELARVSKSLYGHSDYPRRIKSALANLYQADLNGETDTTLQKISVFEILRELPKLGRFLLLASYLASRNEPKLDRKYFTSLRVRKKRRTSTSKRKPYEGIVRRKRITFGKERLLAIAGRLTRDAEAGLIMPENGKQPEAVLGAQTLSQVMSLVHQGLVTVVSSSLDEPKYISRLDDESAGYLARCLSIKLDMYAHHDE